MSFEEYINNKVDQIELSVNDCLIFFAMSWVFRLGIIHNFLKTVTLNFRSLFARDHFG